MSTFQKFGEATLLYAECAAVVDAVYKEFRSDINRFLDCLREEIRQLAEPLQLQEKETSAAHRYWWIAPDSQNKDIHPQLWFDTRLPQIVKPGEIHLTACAPQASGEYLQKLAAVARSPDLSPYCKPGSGGSWSLFNVVVPYPEEDPVPRAAKPIADVLMALHSVHKTKKS